MKRVTIQEALPFLTALAESGGEQTVQGAFADWLQEQGDELWCAATRRSQDEAFLVGIARSPQSRADEAYPLVRNLYREFLINRNRDDDAHRAEYMRLCTVADRLRDAGVGRLSYQQAREQATQHEQQHGIREHQRLWMPNTRGSWFFDISKTGGMVSPEITVAAHDFMSMADELMPKHPVGALSFDNRYGGVAPQAGFMELVNSPHLERIEKLCFSAESLLTQEQFAALVNSPHARFVHELLLSDTHLTDSALDAIIQATGMKNLTKLTLPGNNMTAAGLTRLVNSAAGDELTELRLAGYAVGADSFVWRRLSDRAMAVNAEVNAQTTRALLEPGVLPKLEVLQLAIGDAKTREDFLDALRKEREAGIPALPNLKKVNGIDITTEFPPLPAAQVEEWQEMGFRHREVRT